MPVDGPKRVTMDDIAKELGISKNAVSLALRGKSGVSGPLRSRVLETARRMNYGVVSQSGLVGYIAAFIPRYLSLQGEDSFYQKLCFFMEAYARNRGYQLIISSVSEAEEACPSIPPILHTVPCLGVMTIGNLARGFCEAVAALDMPYVMVDQYYEGMLANSVVTTNISGAYLLTRHLIEQGHRHIEYFGKRFTTASLCDRWTGYARAMMEFGLPVYENSYQKIRTNGHDGEVEQLRNALCAMPSLPTGILCGHDQTAVHVVRVLEEMNLCVPQDVSLIGFDDIQAPQAQALCLTTYRTQRQAIGETAIDLLLGKVPPTNVQIAIHGEVVFRNSVRPLVEKTG